MKTPRSRTPTLVRTALGARLLTACGDAPEVVDTDAASGGQTTKAPTTAPIPTTTDDGDSGTEPASATGPGTLSTVPTTGGCPPDALACAGTCVVELAWTVTNKAVRVHELDGTKLSSAPISEGSRFSSCSTDGFDGDGADEFLVDNDGSAEVLVVSNFAPQYGTLTVLGPPSRRGCPSARREQPLLHGTGITEMTGRVRAIRH
jgi:hypothetical protein